MFSDSALIGTGVLFAVSMLVRIIPTFIPLPFSPAALDRIERLLPIAVFVNLGIYCLSSELHNHLFPAMIGFLTLAVFIGGLRRLGLVLILIVATGTYLTMLRLSL
ncbi:MAG TPA: hypothetical protein VHL08_06755 [Dongiaceae bacterium]|nr:hypothetical protein [Dongiaceae bacterium]